MAINRSKTSKPCPFLEKRSCVVKSRGLRGPTTTSSRSSKDSLEPADPEPDPESNPESGPEADPGADPKEIIDNFNHHNRYDDEGDEDV